MLNNVILCADIYSIHIYYSPVAHAYSNLAVIMDVENADKIQMFILMTCCYFTDAVHFFYAFGTQ